MTADRTYKVGEIGLSSAFDYGHLVGFSNFNIMGGVIFERTLYTFTRI